MTIADQIQQVRGNIKQFCAEAGRSPAHVRLLAVSKTHPTSSIQAAFESGITEFGESYLQEAMIKIEDCRHLPISWHFIGPVQSNKTKDIAENFDWVQSVDREKILNRLSSQRPPHLAPLNICLQVNLFNEPQKQGASAEEIPMLLAISQELPNIKLRGLMVIPPKTDDFQQQMNQFEQVLTTYKQLQQSTPSMDTLSMGMSNDMRAAIFQQTNMIRIGTAIFGSRGTNHLWH